MITPRPLLTVLGAVALLTAGAAAAQADTATETIPAAPCDGVQVVVDATELGGDATVGCAPGDPGSGLEAMESAGFEVTIDDAGLVCAIGGLPDPCVAAEDFAGVFWAAWDLSENGWEFASIGPAEADPAPGDVIGWVYNDGATPPPSPEVDEDASQESEPTEEPEPTEESEPTDGTDAAEADTDDGASPAWWALLAIPVVGIGAGLVIRHKRTQA